MSCPGQASKHEADHGEANGGGSGGPLGSSGAAGQQGDDGSGGAAGAAGKYLAGAAYVTWITVGDLRGPSA